MFTRLNGSSDVVPPGEATLGEIRERLGSRTYLHFACHGRFDMAHPLDSTLYLIGQETLTLRGLVAGDPEVSGLRLAVLSACPTGLIDFVNVPTRSLVSRQDLSKAGVLAVISTRLAGR